MKNEKINLAKFDELILRGKATWWQMSLPSGNVFFGDAKTEMLGYQADDFENYKDFTSLIHKDDYESAMQAMRDHLSGKEKLYETVYRIKNKNGEYIKFYDCGKIVNKDGDNITVMGFVIKIEKNENIHKQMDEFKKLILEEKPSMIDLVQKIKQ